MRDKVLDLLKKTVEECDCYYEQNWINAFVYSTGRLSGIAKLAYDLDIIDFDEYSNYLLKCDENLDLGLLMRED